MGIFSAFYPKEYVDSTYNIDFETMYAEGVRGLIFDIDNTLVPHGAAADSRAVELFNRLRSIGFYTVLLSNNRKERVEPFADAVGSGYIFKAGKPSVKGYEKAMSLMNTDRDSTCFIGDQLFTDVWGANRTGIRTILVRPINPKEEFQIVLKRILERIVLFFYNRRRKNND